MFDEQDRLTESPELLRLLSHYAELGKADRQVWQDRLMELEGAAAKELVKLHGELIAYDWVEQNTGNVTLSRPGVVAACYRITRDGLRALRKCKVGPYVEEEEFDIASAPPEDVKKPRRKREPKPEKVAEVPVLVEATEDIAAEPATDPTSATGAEAA